MYESLQEWVRFPFTFRRIEGKTAAGDKKFSETQNGICYRVDNTEVITDKCGDEYVSRSQLYVPESLEITVDDLVTLDVWGEKLIDKEIRKISRFFDGNEGQMSIQVIYL